MLPPTTGPASSRVAGPPGLGRAAAPLPPSLPPARPKAQDLPQTPAPGLPCTSRRTLARPLHGLAGRLGAPGSQSWARGPIPVFRKIRLRGKSTKSTHEKPTYPRATRDLRETYERPTLHTLPWSRDVDGRGRQAGPTLHLSDRSQKPTNQPAFPPT